MNNSDVLTATVKGTTRKVNVYKLKQKGVDARGGDELTMAAVYAGKHFETFGESQLDFSKN
jgi:hypothetical protein